jgi:Tfp pilus assembly protein PilW
MRRPRRRPHSASHFSTLDQRGPEHRRAQRQQRDTGVSLIELIIAVVLIGSVVGAVLSTVFVTIKGTEVERDHAKAQQWLQAAVGVIEAVDFTSCDPNVITGGNIQSAYQNAVSVGTVDTNGDGVVDSTDGARRPWEYDGTLTVQVPEVWDGDKFVPFGTQVSNGTISVCYDQARLRQQRVRLVVSHPSGIFETVEMIKVDR